MSNATTLQNHNKIISNNNLTIDELIESIENLPEAGSGEVSLQEKTITPTKSSQTITPDETYDGLSKVIVNPIGEEYVIPSGTLDITENGTYDVTDYASANVNIETGGEEENQLHGTLDGTLAYIDSNVTKVIAYACYGITTIKTINLPNCTSIGGNAFRGCSGITDFNAPKVTSLGTYAFYGCSNLTEVNFQGVSQAPSTCFYQCTKLVKADFGVECKTLAGSSFAYCSRLETLILRYTKGVVSIATNTFSGANFDGYVYVPLSLLADYEANSNWASYGGNCTFRAIEDYPEICGEE